MFHALAVILLVGCGAARPRLEITGRPELVTPPSSEYSEVRIAVSPDGDTMLWGSKDRPGGPGSYDIWIARRTSGTWSAPAPVSFNTSAKDYDPAYSPDGRYVYLFSDRPGGLGGDDLYRVAVTGDDFGPAEHLDATINSAGNEWAPVPLRDGSLLFASDGRGGAGRQDLFVAAPRGEGFAPAAPLPGAINTAADEFDATALPDGDLVFSRSTNVATDPVLLVFAHRGATGYDAGTPLSINAGDATYAPAIDGRDPSILYFSGTRPEATLGKRDIYRVRYRVR
jgi:Tol biopolymer transport system component